MEPAGPGVRVDSGVRTGSVIGGAFDSLLAKIIVTGASRAEALERARRVLDETVVEGLPTVLPFHRAVVRDPDFTDEPFRVHTRWIETEWNNELAPWAGCGRGRRAGRPGDRGGRGRREAAGGHAAGGLRRGRRRGRRREAGAVARGPRPAGPRSAATR